MFRQMHIVSIVKELPNQNVIIIKNANGVVIFVIGNNFTLNYYY